MERSKKSIKQTKNVPFYIHRKNELFKLAMVGDNLPPSHDNNYYKSFYKRKCLFDIYACSMIVRYLKKGKYMNELE